MPTASAIPNEPTGPPRGPHHSAAADLIAQHRENPPGGQKLSLRGAARLMSDLFGDRAEMTDMKWARSEQGRRAIPDDELAMMAYTVGIEPEQLAAVDQGAAAELLAGLLQKYPRPDPEQVDPDQPARDALYEALSGLTHESVRAELEREIRQIRNLRGIPEEEREKAIQFLLAQVRLAIQQSHNTVNLLKSR